MLPPKTCYGAPDGYCYFSSMTFVIVTVGGKNWRPQQYFPKFSWERDILPVEV